MGWFWFIPTFHMPHDPASTPMHLILTRKEIDFSVGIGGDIMDVDVSLEWLTESDSDTDTDIQSQPLQNYEPKGMLGTMQGIAGGGIGDAVERGPAGTLSSA
jgi:phosphatidylinositol-3,4,5-trisphosphate 3-phosphatase/dual-specificity protein phosphatase PTEN